MLLFVHVNIIHTLLEIDLYFSLLTQPPLTHRHTDLLQYSIASLYLTMYAKRSSLTVTIMHTQPCLMCYSAVAFLLAIMCWIFQTLAVSDVTSLHLSIFYSHCILCLLLLVEKCHYGFNCSVIFLCYLYVYCCEVCVCLDLYVITAPVIWTLMLTIRVLNRTFHLVL